ncbi:hypothetical protein N9045_00350 [bacterium]|nr:hypothetical protein [bacterium]
MSDNAYYPKLKAVIDTAMSAYEDGKVSVNEVWAFVLVLGDTIQTIFNELQTITEEDKEQVKEAATLLYDEYVKPIDLPGPDYLIDPLLRNGVIPGVVDAAFGLVDKSEVISLAKQSLKSDDGCCGGGHSS